MADSNAGTIYYDIDVRTEKAVDAVRTVEAANSKIGKSFDTAASGANKGSTAFGDFGRKAGMLGIQLEQLAGQATGGVGWMRAMAVQAADIGFIMGAPLLGAIVGVSASLAGPFITSVFGASQEIETLDDALKRLDRSFETAADGSDILSKELIRLAKISREAVRLRLIVEAEDAQKQLTVARNKITEAFREITGGQFLTALDKLEGVTVFDKIAEEIGITADEARRLSEALPSVEEKTNPEAYDRLAAVVANLKEQYGSTNPSVNDLAKALQGANQDAITAAEALNRLKDVNKNLDVAISDSNRKRTEEFKNSLRFSDEEGEILAERLEQEKKYAILSISQQQKQFQDEQTLADQQLTDRLAAIETARHQGLFIGQSYDQAEYEAKALHTERMAELEQKQTEAIQQQQQQRIAAMQTYVSAYSQLGSQLNNLVAVVGAEQTALGKAVFLANQALAVAQIIVSTQQAAAQALTLDPTGTLSARVTALGYASAGIAAGVAIGQTAAGRQTGGPTEAGQMYRVGEAGPEVFSMGGRQYLIGSERGQVDPVQSGAGGAVSVNVSVINEPGVQSEVSDDGRGNLTIRAFITDMDNHGPMHRAITRNTSANGRTK